MEGFHPTLIEWILAGRETMRLRKELEAAQATEKKARETYEKVFLANPQEQQGSNQGGPSGRLCFGCGPF